MYKTRLLPFAIASALALASVHAEDADDKTDDRDGDASPQQHVLSRRS